MNVLRTAEGNLRKTMPLLGSVGALALYQPGNVLSQDVLSKSNKPETSKNQILKQVASKISKLILCVNQNDQKSRANLIDWGVADISLSVANLHMSYEIDAAVDLTTDGRFGKTKAVQIVANSKKPTILKIISASNGSGRWVAEEHLLDPMADPHEQYNPFVLGGPIPSNAEQIVIAQKALAQTQVAARIANPHLSLSSPSC